jgi:phosphatidylglycerophosphate synthase
MDGSVSHQNELQGLDRAMRLLPATLIAFRFLLGPVLFLDARDGTTSGWFLWILTAAAVSDVFDGVIARRLGIVTAWLREADGRTDVWLYSWIVVCAWITHPEFVMAYRIPLLVVIGLQTTSWLIDWIKYRRFSNYHAYTARAWGATLFIATIAWFGFDTAGIFLWAAICAGVICTLEEIAITLTLPRWMHDIPSLSHALRMRAAMRE